MQVRLLWQLLQQESECEQETRSPPKWQLQELRPPLPVSRSCPLTDINACDLTRRHTNHSPSNAWIWVLIFQLDFYLLQVVSLLQSQFFQAQESQPQQSLQLSSGVCRKGDKTTKSGHWRAITVIVSDQISSKRKNLHLVTALYVPHISWHDVIECK